MSKIKKLHPDEFEQECTTVWSFKRRGNWATHKSKYRGNWAPEVVRNLLIRYSNEHDYILDPMVGGGTTAIECKILNRNLLALDINPNAIEITKDALSFESEHNPKIRVELNDARNLSILKDDTIDLILNHPPYVDIIKYSEKAIKEDLSNIHELDEFCDEIEKIAKEFYRVLKPNKYCAILIGDTRRKKMYQPLAFKVMERFLKVGFKLKEDIIKHQHNCKATGFWVNKSKDYNFLLIMHEHLFIFKKVEEQET
ncbi:MAG: methyltransferase domain-containing protein [Epsilonproteobacteria bacterium]|nr:methyltransferase domain-containing protein [Campylobacterota bacterium]